VGSSGARDEVDSLTGMSASWARRRVTPVECIRVEAGYTVHWPGQAVELVEASVAFVLPCQFLSSSHRASPSIASVPALLRLSPLTIDFVLFPLSHVRDPESVFRSLDDMPPFLPQLYPIRCDYCHLGSNLAYLPEMKADLDYFDSFLLEDLIFETSYLVLC
jgi:hypothetical protein